MSRRGLTEDDFDKLLKAVAKRVEPENQPERTYCPDCNHVMRPFYRNCPQCEGERNRRSVEVLAEVIRDIKANVPRTADQERAAMKRLVALNHPCPADFLKAIQTSGDDKPARRRKHDL